MVMVYATINQIAWPTYLSEVKMTKKGINIINYNNNYNLMYSVI